MSKKIDSEQAWEFVGITIVLLIGFLGALIVLGVGIHLIWVTWHQLFTPWVTVTCSS